jgi:phage/plasmid-associated DNA primase
MPLLINQRTGQKCSELAEIKQLFNQMSKDYSKNVANHWCELQTKESCGLMIDLDIYSQISAPQLTNDDYMTIAKIMVEFVVSKIDVKVQMDADFGKEFIVVEIRRPYVIENQEERLGWNAKHQAYKDGCHYLFPNLHFDRETKRWLISQMISEKILGKLLSKYTITDPDAVIDVASAYVPTLLIGSCKRDRDFFYPIKAVYKYEVDTNRQVSINNSTGSCDEKKVISGSFSPISILGKRDNPILEFSLNKWGFETRVTDKEHYELLPEFKAAMEAAVSARAQKLEEKSQNNENFRPSDDDIKSVMENRAEFMEILEYIVCSYQPDRAKGFRPWSGVLKCLKNLQITYELEEKAILEIADLFSQRCAEAYKDKTDVCNYFNQCEAFGYFSMLMYWLKQDNEPRCAHAWRRYFKICPPKSKYRYFSDRRKLLYKNAEDEKNKVRRTDTTISEAYEWATNAIFYIENCGKGKYITKGKSFNAREKVEYEFFKEVTYNDLCFATDFNISVVAQNNKKKYEEKIIDLDDETLTADSVPELQELSLRTVFLDALRNNQIDTYDKCEFFPYLNENPLPHNIFNMFVGYPIKKYKPKTKLSYTDSHLYKHINEQLCAGDQTSVDFANAWIAQLIQEPADVPGTSLLFYSQQGNGKDLFGKFISRMIGSEYFGIYDNPDMFFSNFNSDMSGMLLCVLNEVCDKGAAYAKHNLLKSYITREEAKIEPKGKDKFKASMYCRYALFTNNANPVFIENSDRRFAMFRCKNDYAQNEKYFKAIVDEIGNPDFIRAAFEYYSTLDYSKVNLRTAPENAYKLEQKVSNMPGPLRFIKELYDEDFDLTLCGGIARPTKKDVVISKNSLYELYKGSATRRGDVVVKIDTFMNCLSQIGLECIQTKVEKANVRRLCLSRSAVQDGFRKFLRNESFDFDQKLEDEANGEEFEEEDVADE